ncbi:hypothetical protein MRB53_042392 [Persea americana]|nr:hypothetical protein MRB53_042392 [Persea americana]
MVAKDSIPDGAKDVSNIHRKLCYPGGLRNEACLSKTVAALSRSTFRRNLLASFRDVVRPTVTASCPQQPSS